MKSRSLILLAAALMASGCARTGITLLPGEKGLDGSQRPVGALAVLDPETGADVGLLDQENANGSVRGRTLAKKMLSGEETERRYGDLLGALPEQPRLFVLYFKEGSAELVDESTALIPELFAEVKRRPGVDLQVVGHTDTVGDGSSNDSLSVRRAEEVRAMLVRMGLEGELVRATGRGEREPLEPTGDNVASVFNRRVEVLVK